MKKTLSLILISLLFCSVLLSAKGKAESTSSVKRPLIAVSILPQQYAVDRISGKLADTVVLVGPGQNPHAYEPTPRQMSALADADAWILSNTDFEIALISKIRSLYPTLLIVDGTEGVTFRSMEEHTEGEVEDDHAHHGHIDRHTWLGREPMKILATHIERTLSTIDSTHAQIYQANLAQFLVEIDQLYDSLVADLAPLQGTTVFVYHPSFGYLLDDFGITQKAVETGGKEPTAKNLAQLIQEAQANNVQVLFVQAQFPVSAAQNIAQAIGAEVLALDPLAYDWLANIQMIGDTLQRTLVTEGNGAKL
ncbi:MAG: zinc ABC transporter substrate-binding protein [Sphaerochaetaceae bacterium]|jgi:zinc transport system substrate-binding protein|nr:zinc ABC transporter substrate-binding protein [Sphaerochaetaceae bacterium]MDY0371058.1 zinc ABC transporter substrate-binding protein [Sphaerochaetaceae bacterium]